MINVRNPRVIAAIIDCYSLPISKKCDLVFYYPGGGLTFVFDEYSRPQQIVKVEDISFTFEIDTFGPIFSVHRRGDIYSWNINPTTGESEYHCTYNTIGKVKYGRYYEPSMD